MLRCLPSVCAFDREHKFGSELLSDWSSLHIVDSHFVFVFCAKILCAELSIADPSATHHS